MVKVRVPATSANLGSGFDACGLAVSLYNGATFEEHDGVDVSSADGTFVPKGENNLIYHTAKEVYQMCDKPFKGLRIVQTNQIPMARGLGSSSACIVAGILGANALLGNVLSQQEMLTIATKIEGHPDNVAPAFLGGFVTAALDDGQVYALQKSIADSISFAAFIPNYSLRTEKARAALPKQITHKDAVYNLSRAALLATAFCEERYDLLSVATKDCLHQQYRMPLMQGAQEVFALAKELGALAHFVSGAGPTILAVVPKENTSFFETASAQIAANPALHAYQLHHLQADNMGAIVE